MKLSDESLQKVLACDDYRSFILTYKFERSVVKPFSYSLISKRAGFLSSSFPRDVAHGTKRITISSLYPMIRGFGIRGDLAELFKTLVNIEHPDTCFQSKSVLDLRKKLTNIRDRVRKKHSLIKEEDPYQIEFFPIIYAACGDKYQGASFLEIQRKTGLQKHQIKIALDALVAMGLLTFSKSKYFHKDNHLFFKAANKNENMKKLFLYLLDQTAKKASKDFNSKSNLFFTSCFSVQKARIPELKNELRQLLLQFVDESEDPEGEKIVSLACSLI